MILNGTNNTDTLTGAEDNDELYGGGAVVNLSSVAGIVGGPNILAYNASKGAVRLMTKGAALEAAPLKVRSL